ncbi:diacylglycerol kinase family protein [Peribacillus tepidiphilus]|uniref:diacylglycerol kinase family protein n=1 Tax=Peribacillus tepidiphilus TaxID=2652445 RepID=UPI001291CA9B|nr:diacylglycerol kinase family protein [Peribacillus tepidiphilus]
MSMDFKDNQGKKPPFQDSVRFALEGIRHAFKVERNLRIHLIISIIVIMAGFLLSLSPFEWLFIFSAISGTIVTEMINSAIERTVDLVTKECHPLAKQAKDIAAGAVLIFAFYSVIVGFIIFIPKLVK